MAEHLHGIEALKNLPLKEVVISQSDATNKLKSVSRLALVRNVNQFKTTNPEIANSPYWTVRFQDVFDDPEAYDTTGSSLDDEGVNRLYSDPQITDRSFSNLITHFVTNAWSNRETMNPDVTRNSSVVWMGYILDVMGLLNPEVANQNDGAEILLDVIRRLKCQKELL